MPIFPELTKKSGRKKPDLLSASVFCYCFGSRVERKISLTLTQLKKQKIF